MLPIRRLQESLAVLSGYIVLAVALTWPVAGELTQALPDGGDDWRFLWNLWWVKTALLDLHTNPFRTDLLYYPNGVNLYIDTLAPFIGLLSIPLQVAGLSLVAVYNLLMLFSFVAAGYGAYLLARHLTGARLPAFVAGVVFAFAPYHFAQMLGHLNLAAIQWIPCYVLAVYHAWDARTAVAQPADDPAPARRWRSLPKRQIAWAALAGVWLAVTVYTEWTYALFLGLWTLWFLVWRWWRAGHRRAWRVSVARAGVLAGVSLVLVAPILLPALSEARSNTFAQTDIKDSIFFSLDLTSAFIPSGFHPLWPNLGLAMDERYLTQPRSERVGFVGYTVLLLAAGAVAALRRRRDVRFWALTVLGAWILSLGPILHIWGERIFFGTRIPLPYAVLYFVPLLNIARVPSRFTVLVMLGLALLVAYALAALPAWPWRMARESAVARAAICVAAGVLIVVEFLAVPYPMQKWNYDEPFYHELASEPGQFGVLELPLAPLAIYEGYQTIHHRPIVGGYLARQPPDPFVAGTPVLRYLSPATPVDDPLGTEAARTGLADLRRANVRYVIVHLDRFYGADPAVTQAKVARAFPGVPARYLQGDPAMVLSLEP